MQRSIDPVKAIARLVKGAQQRLDAMPEDQRIEKDDMQDAWKSHSRGGWRYFPKSDVWKKIS